MTVFRTHCRWAPIIRIFCVVAWDRGVNTWGLRWLVPIFLLFSSRHALPNPMVWMMQGSRQAVEPAQSRFDSYQCQHCSRTFPTSAERSDHERLHVYNCRQCSKVFTSTSALLRHTQAIPQQAEAPVCKLQQVVHTAGKLDPSSENVMFPYAAESWEIFKPIDSAIPE